MTIKIILLICAQLLAKSCGVDSKHANFSTVVSKYGYPVEEVDVQTEDGYVLKLFHIKGDKNRPVLLLHGLIDSADTFKLRGLKSWAVTLAREGYDVWAGSTRGSTYSRRHIYLNPDEKPFWQFSFHDVGYYDLPAFIDYILKANRVKKLSAVAHSQGNTNFYVLGATRPEYNQKVKILLSLGPVCFVNNLPVIAELMVQARSVLNGVLMALNEEEVFNLSLRTFLRNWCLKNKMQMSVCREVIFQLGGRDEEEFEEEFFPHLIRQYPTSTSRRNVLHLAQISADRTFRQFDYGRAENLKVYKTESPPDYDLSKVTMPVALFVGKNDKLTSPEDVKLLVERLPNIVEYRIIPREIFNHMDHLWGKNMDKHVFPYGLNVLKKYNKF